MGVGVVMPLPDVVVEATVGVTEELVEEEEEEEELETPVATEAEELEVEDEPAKLICTQ